MLKKLGLPHQNYKQPAGGPLTRKRCNAAAIDFREWNIVGACAATGRDVAFVMINKARVNAS